MIIQTPIVTVRRIMLNCLIPVIFILSTNSILAIGTNPEIQNEKIYLIGSVEKMMTIDTMDYSVLTQKELKQELKKLKKTNPALYNKVKSEFLEPNIAVRVAIVMFVTFTASLLGLLVGCVIYSFEQ